MKYLIATLSLFLLLTAAPAHGDHDPWAGVIQCESGGNPSAYNGAGPYGGLFQFHQGTWNHAAELADRPDLVGVWPGDASVEDQYQLAEALRAAEGIGHWPNCGRLYQAPHPEEVEADEPATLSEPTPEPTQTPVETPTATPVPTATPDYSEPVQVIPAPVRPGFTG